MNRRSFLSTLGKAAVGAALATSALDPERLLWVPGQKVYFDIHRPFTAAYISPAVRDALAQSFAGLFKNADRIHREYLRDAAYVRGEQWDRADVEGWRRDRLGAQPFVTLPDPITKLIQQDGRVFALTTRGVYEIRSDKTVVDLYSSGSPWWAAE